MYKLTGIVGSRNSAVLLLTLWMISGRAGATTFTVTNTSSSGPGSLRQAILNANNSVGPDIIAFNIPGLAVQRIHPTNELPWITDTVLIDGYTQPGASPSTSFGGPKDAVLKIVLQGDLAG